MASRSITVSDGTKDDAVANARHPLHNVEKGVITMERPNDRI